MQVTFAASPTTAWSIDRGWFISEQDISSRKLWGEKNMRYLPAQTIRTVFFC